MKISFKAKLLEIEQGQNEVVLNEAQAVELNIELLDRVRLELGERETTAIVDYSHTFVKQGEIGLFDEVAKALGARTGDAIFLEATHRPDSLDAIKKKLDGQVLSREEIDKIISDLMEQQLSDSELAIFTSAIYTRGMTLDETADLTNAIYASGESLEFARDALSLHSIGGVSGDRVTLVVVPIIASLDLLIPKTSSRAISSASGTADAMEVLAKVTFSKKEIEAIVNKTNGCIVWGGAVYLAPAEERLIKVRNPLCIDPKPLLLSSILAKKKAEGAKYVLIDIPVGRGAKVEKMDEARVLAREFESIGAHLGMRIESIITDGSEPLLSAVGPALEARTVLHSLEARGKENPELVEKACLMAGVLLKMVRGVTKEEGYRIARHQVYSGKALAKFKEIIAAQGGNPGVEPEDISLGKFTARVFADEEGTVSHVDNKKVAFIARALGAPTDKKAGIILFVKKGRKVSQGDAVMEFYSDSQEKLAHALEMTGKCKVIEVERILLEA